MQIAQGSCQIVSTNREHRACTFPPQSKVGTVDQLLIEEDNGFGSHASVLGAAKGEDVYPPLPCHLCRSACGKVKDQVKMSGRA